MGKYIVLKRFVDLKDGNHLYKKDDIYPREGIKSTKKRINELSTTNNRRKTILIQEVKEDDSGSDSGDSN